jgi:hypothetical protein
MRSDAEMAAAILSRARPGDAVLATSLTSGPLEYYARRAGVRLPAITFPRDDSGHPALQDQAVWRGRPGELAHEAGAAVGEACRARGPGGRLFAVIGLEEFNRPLIQLLAPRGRAAVVRLPGERRITITNTPVQLWLLACPAA